MIVDMALTVNVWAEFGAWVLNKFSDSHWKIISEFDEEWNAKITFQCNDDKSSTLILKESDTVEHNMALFFNKVFVLCLIAQNIKDTQIN